MAATPTPSEPQHEVKPWTPFPLALTPRIPSPVRLSPRTPFTPLPKTPVPVVLAPWTPKPLSEVEKIPGPLPSASASSAVSPASRFAMPVGEFVELKWPSWTSPSWVAPAVVLPPIAIVSQATSAVATAAITKRAKVLRCVVVIGLSSLGPCGPLVGLDRAPPVADDASQPFARRPGV